MRITASTGKEQGRVESGIADTDTAPVEYSLVLPVENSLCSILLGRNDMVTVTVNELNFTEKPEA